MPIYFYLKYVPVLTKELMLDVETKAGKLKGKNA